MNPLTHRYLQYYSRPTIHSAIELAKAILEPQRHETIVMPEVLPLLNGIKRPLTKGTWRQLSSSGSTKNEPTLYFFGPHANFWMSKVEHAIKNPKGKTYVFISVHWGMNPGPSQGAFSGDPPHLIFNYIVNCNWYGHTQRLVGYLQKLPHPLIVASDPKTFLYLLKDKEFLAAAEANEWELSSTGSTAFFSKPPVYMNDNMVDWATGLNFYQCREGTRHFLPLFTIQNEKARNLLNLLSPIYRHLDDWVELDHSFTCPCGEQGRISTFVSHRSCMVTTPTGSLLDLSALPDSLEATYKNLQFVQTGDCIQVLYATQADGKISLHDSDRIVQEIHSQGFRNVSFLKNRLIFTSARDKTAAYYNNVASKEICPFPKPWKTRSLYI